jgi:EAL domain-containing protein (putative c-di-GMP-specific phosphodiesterase class I)
MDVLRSFASVSQRKAAHRRSSSPCRTEGIEYVAVAYSTAANMPTSTIPTNHSFLLDSHERCDGLSYPPRLDGFSSAAGLQRRPWLTRLRRALREDLFVLHYQPIVALPSGEVSHYEALVRLGDEPDGRLIAPGVFLPAAERYGLIQEIDRMVIGKVVELLGAQLAGQDMRVAVNLSALSITDSETLAHIERELAQHRVVPSRLVIEVTETAAISDMARAKAFCDNAAALGCAIALDDFGVGFGSFYYVKRLPFRYLKIDGEFIRELPSCAQDQLMVKALVGLARGMGMRTIAEFVGDAQTLELLCDLGVDYAQGFEVGRPQAEIRCERLAPGPAGAAPAAPLALRPAV